MKYWVVFLAIVAPALSAQANDPFWSLLDPIASPQVVAQAHEGETFLSVAAHHRRVGVLENDIRGAGIVNSDRIVIPKGTPLYFASFGTSGRFASQYEGWCGLVQEKGKVLGYCMFPEGRDHVLAKLPDNESLFLPTRLANYGMRVINAPQVRIDDSVRDQFPKITFSYALDAWRPGGVVLERRASVGDTTVNLGSFFFDRARDRTTPLVLGSYSYVLTMAERGEAVQVAPAP